MTSASSCPAIYAGLLGSNAGLLTASSKAIVLGESSSMRIFIMGCFGGAAVAGVAALILSLSLRKRDRDDDDDDEVPDLRGYAQQRRANAGDTRSMQAQTAPAQAGVPKREGVRGAMPAQAAGLPAQASFDARRPRAAAPRPSVRPMQAAAPSPVVRPTQAAAPSPSARHMRVAAAPRATEAPVAMPVQELGDTGRLERSRQRGYQAQGLDAVVPRVSARPRDVFAEAAAKPQVAEAANDYGEVAESYVRRQTLRERMAARAAGVASVLAERLGGDMFDDLPVIERADGSVADVGTSWWDSALESSIRRPGAVIQDTDPRPVAQASMAATPNPAPASGVTGSLEMAVRYRGELRQGSAAFDPSLTRAQVIARSVAEVDRGVFPEKRDPSELDSQDLWDVALAAMSEKIAAQSAAPVFSDGVGGIDSIDEPGGLEGSTSFIAFKRPKGHPEVVDNESYVDYLIGEEFGNNASQAARTSSRHYLRLIQGGSQKSRPLKVAEKRDAYVPKHFAPANKSLLAKEA